MSAVRTLLKDVEEKFPNNQIDDGKTKISKYGLNIIDEMNSENEFQKNRTEYLESEVGIDASKNEVSKMFLELETLLDEYNTRGIKAEIEQDKFQLAFKAKGFSFLLAFGADPSSRNSANFLFVKFWKGYIRIKKIHNFAYSPGEIPQLEITHTFTFSRLRDLTLIWQNVEDTNEQKTSSQIVDMCAKWLAMHIRRSNL
jgi:hypothetical protein